jgi:hypothetical protein
LKDLVIAQATVGITLSQAEALVLFEFLSRYSRTNTLDIVDQAERRVLWDVCSQLERVLVEPLAPDYGERVEQARYQVRDVME